MATLNVYVPDHFPEEIKKIAEEEKRSVSKIVALALSKELNIPIKLQKEKLKKEKKSKKNKKEKKS